MGKGDRKSKKGKIWRGTHGKRRPRKTGKAYVAKTESAEKKKQP